MMQIKTNTERIYTLLKKRRKLKEKDFQYIFGVKDFRMSSAKFRYIDAIIRVLQKIGSDDDLFITCKNCGYANPLDRDYTGMTEQQEFEDNFACEQCGVNCFKPIN